MFAPPNRSWYRPSTTLYSPSRLTNWDCRHRLGFTVSGRCGVVGDVGQRVLVERQRTGIRIHALVVEAGEESAVRIVEVRAVIHRIPLDGITVDRGVIGVAGFISAIRILISSATHSPSHSPPARATRALASLGALPARQRARRPPQKPAPQSIPDRASATRCIRLTPSPRRCVGAAIPVSARAPIPRHRRRRGGAQGGFRRCCSRRSRRHCRARHGSLHGWSGIDAQVVETIVAGRSRRARTYATRVDWQTEQHEIADPCGRGHPRFDRWHRP